MFDPANRDKEDTQTLRQSQATRYNNNSAASLTGGNTGRHFRQQSQSIISSKPAIASGTFNIKQSTSPNGSTGDFYEVVDE